jgi:hypothetical protein
MNTTLPGIYLDHGFHVISANRAGRICKPFNGLPRRGYERKVELTP